MGQYWIATNLDKREFIHPHKLGTGLKLWEHLRSHPGTGAALVILCAAMPARRGGGDLEPDPIIGRWAGDRIALVGDYAEQSDLVQTTEADIIYHLCIGDRVVTALHWMDCDWTEDPKVKAECRDKAERLLKAEPFTDITEQVRAVIEREMDGKYEGDLCSWLSWKYNEGPGPDDLPPHPAGDHQEAVEQALQEVETNG